MMTVSNNQFLKKNNVRIIILRVRLHLKIDVETPSFEDQKNNLLLDFKEKFSTHSLKKTLNSQGDFRIDAHTDYNIPQDTIEKIVNTPNLRKEILVVNETTNSFYSGTVNSKNQKHGLGLLMNSKGEQFEGYWEKDCFQPYGRYINEKGEMSEGSFENGKLNGEGRVLKADKEYKGTFFYGMRNGLGKEISEAEEYEGNFKNDKKDGQGKIFFKKSLNNYVGEFKEGKMNGQCEFSWNNGDRYEGNIVNGVFDGRGKYFWNDGMEYEGNYDKGVRRGFGTFKWKDGKIYKGEFENNLPHGNGIIIHNGIERNVKSLFGQSVNLTQESAKDDKMIKSKPIPSDK